ncbi:hypothetical protein KEM54_001530 [Ascosphaera aggregata]|nr:hypothetical protein KEM54_001530 [Ascosphaera aggregata]
MQDTPSPEAQIRNRLKKVLGLIRAHGLRAKAEDFLVRRISLVDQIKLPREVIGSKLERVYKKRILLKEELANQVVESTGLQKESPITRSGQTHWRPDPRGQRIRNSAHEMCAQAIDVYPWLNEVERRILIRATRCFPDDALSFWHYTTLSRLSYLAMGDAAQLGEFKKQPAAAAPLEGLEGLTRSRFQTELCSL